MSSYIDIVFDGPPEAKAGRFVEVEDETGASILAGEWIEREDGYWALRIPRNEIAVDVADDYAAKVAAACDLKRETCYDLLAAGWHLEHKHHKPTRWVQGRTRRDIPASVALAQGTIIFEPGAIVIQGDPDPQKTAHEIAAGMVGPRP